MSNGTDQTFKVTKIFSSFCTIAGFFRVEFFLQCTTVDNRGKKKNNWRKRMREQLLLVVGIYHILRAIGRVCGHLIFSKLQVFSLVPAKCWFTCDMPADQSRLSHSILLISIQFFLRRFFKTFIEYNFYNLFFKNFIFEFYLKEK